MKKTCTFLCVGVILAFGSVLQADEGFPDPISIDRESPSVAFGSTIGDIYDWVGPPGSGWDAGGPGPVIHVQDITYGLSTNDNNDAHSRGDFVDDGQFALLSIYFSGHDNRSLLSGDVSMGLPNTDYLNQAVRNQAAGDRFMLNGMTTLSPQAVMLGAGPSGVSLPFYPGANGNYPINLLSANQTNYNEIPSLPPNVFNAYSAPAGSDVQDDMDALELMAFDLSGDRVHDVPIYLSLDSISPGLLGPTPSGADIYVSPAPAAPPGSYHVYAESTQLGLDLTPGANQLDEVDALVIWASNHDLVNPGTDYALFSLAPSSPTLWGGDGQPGMAGVDDDGLNGPDDLGEVGFGDDMSPADIFVTDFSGAFKLYLAANTIGMRNTDNVDSLDAEIQLQDPIDSMPGSPMGPTVMGDFNLDGQVDVSDLGILAGNYGTPTGMKWANGDADGNEAVDVSDLGALAGWYGTHTAAAAAASVPEPSTVIVLLSGLVGLAFFRMR
ncbi:MAG: PEP-CTERM sorting domain-containing protein [Pirellulales bacterium]|nr:PEP-CTERM sorting domain-containing protein [Pirellulales bacterium]